MPNSLKYLIAGAVCMMSAGCQNPAATPDPGWAVNVGGDRYVGVDGTEYAPDSSISGGAVGTLDAVKGSQDEPLYATYRKGDMEISRPMANGIYDITLHFAEPDDVPGGARLFDTVIEGATMIDDLDVMRSRDGKVRSALTVTVPGVRIDDGELNIEFTATAKEPILSALVVREKQSSSPAWRLTHSDEFDYAGAPRSSMWNADLWPARVVNDEDQAYTNNPRNLRVEDGYLIIEAHKEDLDNAKYTSARIHTLGKVDLLYGRIEVRAKLPRGKGTWPAIWMLPSAPFRYATKCEEGDTWQGSADCDAWPNSGEIDIMEHVGYEMGHVHGTVHNEAYYWAKWEQRKGRIIVDDVDQAFHVYALEWTPERIDVFLDDTLYFTYVNEHDGWRSWPYDHPFHLILNVAVGGMWGRAGGGIDDTIFPQKMVVDYVRFFERSSPSNEGDQ
ncbi:MAG: family 16 glycosylhydrolase [Gammaproteobacteria bacterium]|nr:family 16 glycosylhydrolase [Gammaproteobacteria bacterium]